MILYLHGFRSSPQSFKARLIGARLQALGRGAEYHCPQLPASPAAAIALALNLADQSPSEQIVLIGSSLGGYYATYLAEQLGCRAVLLNPAVKPPRELEKYVGITTAWHSDELFEFRHEYIDELKALQVTQITRAERYFLLAATGDEILDWREMVTHYPGARQHVIEGSDHGISDFERYMDEVMAFCAISPEPAK
jgi:uncharacterized protein